MFSIGVGIPTYRRQDELGRLLSSIPPDVAVWVSDNGATLEGVFRELHASVQFSKQEPVLPMFSNWNAAARRVTSEWVAVPSDDDIYLPGAFDMLRSVLEQHSEADVIIFGHQFVGERYEFLSSWCPERLEVLQAPLGFGRFRNGVQARMPSIFFRRGLLERLDYFDEQYMLTAADSDLVQRALLHGTCVFVPQVISGYRIWNSSLTHAHLASELWMAEVDRWARKIERELLNDGHYAKQATRIRDSLYGENLHAGIAQLCRQQSWGMAWTHFCRSRYPFHARPRLQLAILFQSIHARLRTLSRTRRSPDEIRT